MIIVAEQATKALPSHPWLRVATHVPLRAMGLVSEALLCALRMRVGQGLPERILQRAFTQYDHLLQRLLAWPKNGSVIH
jgi:hypothetical protein